MTRPTWDEYFMSQCDLIASRSTCDRKHVGCVIVKDKFIISTGFNGSLPNTPHCSDPSIFKQCRYCGNKIDANTDPPWTHCPNCYNRLEEGDMRHGGHDMEGDRCIRTSHSEVNAIAQS